MCPLPLRPRFGAYPPMFARMFETAGAGVRLRDRRRSIDGAPFPDPAALDGILITGSAAGVYDSHFTWMEPLRAFIRAAYAAKTPMLGICFGHQIMADALGGDVRKSEKGWGLGRHVYGVTNAPGVPRRRPAGARHRLLAPGPGDRAAGGGRGLPCLRLHARTPGSLYRNGAAISLQPHPEFDDDYTLALAELRRGKAPDDVDRHGPRLGRDAVAQPRGRGLPRRVPQRRASARRSAAISARSSASPRPVSLEVTMTSGCAAGRLAIAAVSRRSPPSSSRGDRLVGLGQHDLVAHRGLVELVHHREVVGLGAVPPIDQHVDAPQVRPAGEVFVDQLGPRLDLGLRRLRKAVARHVDDAQRSPRPPRRC